MASCRDSDQPGNTLSWRGRGKAQRAERGLSADDKLCAVLPRGSLESVHWMQNPGPLKFMFKSKLFDQHAVAKQI